MANAVTEKVTQKLGPLPVWAWAGIVAGGYLIARRMGGGGNDSSAGVVGGAPQVIGGGEGGGVGDGLPYDDSALVERLTAIETGNQDFLDRLTNVEGSLPGLSEAITNSTTLNTLQTKLATLLQQYSAALAQREHWRSVYRTSTGAKKAEAEKNREKYDAQAASLLKQITATQDEIKKVGA